MERHFRNDVSETSIPLTPSLSSLNRAVYTHFSFESPTRVLRQTEVSEGDTRPRSGGGLPINSLPYKRTSTVWTPPSLTAVVYTVGIRLCV